MEQGILTKTEIKLIKKALLNQNKNKLEMLIYANIIKKLNKQQQFKTNIQKI